MLFEVGVRDDIDVVALALAHSMNGPLQFGQPAEPPYGDRWFIRRYPTWLAD